MPTPVPSISIWLHCILRVSGDGVLFLQATNKKSEREFSVKVQLIRKIHVDQYNGQAKRQKKRLWVSLGLPVMLCLLIGASVLSVIGYHSYTGLYQRDTALAQVGIEHVQKAETLFLSLAQNPLNEQTITQARQELLQANTIFNHLSSDLATLPAGTTSIPVYGSRIEAIGHVLSLAQSLTQAGITGCNAFSLLITRLHDPLNPQSHGITQTDFTTITHDFQLVENDLTNAYTQLAHVQFKDVQFNARLSKAINKLQTYLPMALTWMYTFSQMLPVLPTLLGIGTPTNYLLEVLDSTELRPGGGFIGNYGYATLSGGRLTAAHITDVDLLDRPFEAAGKTIAVPPQYKWFNEILGPGGWSLRDSDLDANFPTSARAALTNYRLEGGTTLVQGVIAITPTVMEQIMQITGPISVPEYGDMVTAQNLVALIHYHQLGGPAAGQGSDRIPSPDGYSSLRKRFTAILATNLLTRVRQLAPTEAAKFMRVFINGVRTKDVQMYFTAPSAEKLLTLAHLDDSIQAPKGDSLMLVDANLSPSKANSFITNTVNDQVTLTTQGEAIHHLTLTYAWNLPGRSYGNPTYRDYLQVYIPPGSHLQSQSGWQPYPTTSAHGREVLAGFFTLVFGETHTITLTWVAPHAVIHDRSGWQYHYLVQRQAGILRTLRVQITLPPCATGITATGHSLTRHGQEILLSEDLAHDTTTEVNYACSAR